VIVFIKNKLLFNIFVCRLALNTSQQIKHRGRWAEHLSVILNHYAVCYQLLSHHIITMILSAWYKTGGST